MRGLAVALVLVSGAAGCTRLGFGVAADGAAGEQTIAPDLSFDADDRDSSVDGANDQTPTPPPVCDWRQGPPSGPGTVLAQLNSDSNETDPFLSADGLTLYFGSVRSNVPVTMIARRASRSAAFETPEVAPAPINVAGGTNARFETDAQGTFAVLSGQRQGFEAELFTLNLTTGNTSVISALHTPQREADRGALSEAA